MASKKGPSFERDVSKMLSLWWTQDERDDVFWRTASSGARATQRRKLGKQTAYSHGDITFIDPIGQPLIDFALISLKRGYSDKINPLDLLDGGNFKSLLKLWWWEAEQERQHSNRHISLVLFKRDYRDICIVYNQLFAYTLADFHFPVKNNEHLFVRADCYQLYIARLQEFLDSVYEIERFKKMMLEFLPERRPENERQSL